jgi:hypothetical protein
VAAVPATALVTAAAAIVAGEAPAGERRAAAAASRPPSPRAIAASNIAATPGLTLVAGDFHFPEQDDAAVAVFLETCRQLKPSRVILNGDLPVFPGWGGIEYLHTTHLARIANKVGLVSLVHTREQSEKKHLLLWLQWMFSLLNQLDDLG